MMATIESEPSISGADDDHGDNARVSDTSFQEFRRPLAHNSVLYERNRVAPILLGRNLHFNKVRQRRTNVAGLSYMEERSDASHHSTLRLSLDLTVSSNGKAKDVTMFCVVGQVTPKGTEIVPLKIVAFSTTKKSAAASKGGVADVTVPFWSREPFDSEASGDKPSTVLLMIIWDAFADLSYIQRPRTDAKAKQMNAISLCNSNGKIFSLIPPNSDVIWDCVLLEKGEGEWKYRSSFNFKRGKLQASKLHFGAQSTSSSDSTPRSVREGPWSIFVTPTPDPSRPHPYDMSMNMSAQYSLMEGRRVKAGKMHKQRASDAGNVTYQYCYTCVLGNAKRTTKMKTQALTGWTCPFCYIPHTSFGALEMHLAASHALFTYDFNEPTVTVYPPDDAAFEHKDSILTRDPAPTLPGLRHNANKEFFFSKAFNQRYSMLPHAILTKEELEMQNQKRFELHQHGRVRSVGDDFGVAGPSKRLRREDRTPKTFFAKDGAFYHSRTGLQMTPAEIYGDVDSDDEVDDYGQRMRILKCAPSRPSERNFMLRWNQYMQAKGAPVADREMHTCCLAFVNENAQDLCKDAGMHKCLQEHLLVQWDHGLLSANSVKHINDAMNNYKNALGLPNQAPNTAS